MAPFRESLSFDRVSRFVAVWLGMTFFCEIKSFPRNYSQICRDRRPALESVMSGVEMTRQDVGRYSIWLGQPRSHSPEGLEV